MFPGLRRQYGVVVAARSGNPPYTGSGLQPGDVIYMLNGSPIATVETLRSSLDQQTPGSALVLQVERNGRLMFLTIELE
ncbi:MAG: PDZ domain-containing protein [Bryobacterales bacterium]|nr:PDZ domain-containing protein [Bryobacterales bacterium]